MNNWLYTSTIFHSQLPDDFELENLEIGNFDEAGVSGFQIDDADGARAVAGAAEGAGIDDAGFADYLVPLTVGVPGEDEGMAAAADQFVELAG